MKGPLDRTKVVLRHLPPTISQSSLTEHVDSRFSGRYRWLSFHPGKSSQKHLFYSRAYIDFNRPEDVVEFAEYFDGHIFVNEKGTQFKTIVEYAPSQRVPKQWSKKDGREGTILKDPEYQEFLEFIAKPVENLPSAEIQLERKESERAGAPKDAPIVTPLMDFVRQRRAAKSGTRRSALNGKPPKRGSGASSRTPNSGSSKRGSEKRRTSTTMYVSRDNSKAVSGKDKSTYILVKRDDQQLSDKSVILTSASGTAALEEETGGSGFTDVGKKKMLLLKGKERESPTNQRHEASGRVIRSILLNKDSRQDRSPSGAQSEREIQTSNQDRDKKPPRPQIVRLFQKDINGAPDHKADGNAIHAVHTEKRERRTRNKDRPDRGVWTPLQRSDGSHASDESLSSYTSQSIPGGDSAEGTHGEVKIDMPSVHGTEFRSTGSGRGSHHSVDNGVGSFRHGGRRGSAYNIKDADGPSVVESKTLKRGGSAGYSSNEKQVWIQKSSSGS
ncbi:regulator of nonsense transcripts UPF3-like [Olea europaea subsp. europaea]|uniref:Regulator of nonsense transcripts UPF3-like n=1 Tax=Olea europaea subsp. europaea TaxID=158383 RepID=A0A8S0QMV0_OLEEU|nr:regulator of nonsense transcripts UPF3-like [Olea europaea subsp. europaea]